MSDTSQTESATTPSTSTTPTPLPNDSAARSPTGEILEPSQIAAQTSTTPEAKPDGTPAPTSTSTDPKAEAKPDAKTVPDSYADFTAPEGYTLDQAAIKDALPIFKELGLTQDQAQKLVSFHAAQMIEAAKAPQTTYEQTRATWRTEVESDSDIKAAVSSGKTGLEAVKVDIGRALTAIGDAQLAQDFKHAMNLTGAGDNPAFIKTLWKLSQFVTEGKHVPGTNPSPHGQRAPNQGDRPSPAKSLYPNLPG